LTAGAGFLSSGVCGEILALLAACAGYLNLESYVPVIFYHVLHKECLLTPPFSFRTPLTSTLLSTPS
jgi:hypothetical protein